MTPRRNGETNAGFSKKSCCRLGGDPAVRISSVRLPGDKVAVNLVGRSPVRVSKPELDVLEAAAFDLDNPVGNRVAYHRNYLVPLRKELARTARRSNMNGRGMPPDRRAAKL